MSRATKQQFENRLSKIVVQRIYDDNNDGQTDTDPVQDCLDDASAKVDSYLAPVGLLPLSPPYPREVIRLELDVAQVYAAQRFPEIVRVDWKELLKASTEDLDNLRKGKTMLGSAPPDPAANHGATVQADDGRSDATTTGTGRTFDTMGDF
jgi:phage gp36-like protein